MSAWATGVADVRAIHTHHITVACPHCYGQHTHQRQSLGSASVIAGCHTGHGRCREYSIPAGVR